MGADCAKTANTDFNDREELMTKSRKSVLKSENSK